VGKNVFCLLFTSQTKHWGMTIANKKAAPVRRSDLLVPIPKLRLRDPLREVMRLKKTSAGAEGTDQE